MNKERKPRYWLLDALLLAMMVLLYLVMQANISSTGKQLLEIGMVVLGSGLMGLWIYANADALEADEQRKREQRPAPEQAAGLRPRLNERQRHYLEVKNASLRHAPEEP